MRFASQLSIVLLWSAVFEPGEGTWIAVMEAEGSYLVTGKDSNF